VDLDGARQGRPGHGVGILLVSLREMSDPGSVGAATEHLKSVELKRARTKKTLFHLTGRTSRRNGHRSS